MEENAHGRPNTAGFVVVRFRSKLADPEFLLLRSYHYWDFPKGLIERGETPFDAAVRETREETGIVDLHYPWGLAHRDTPRYRRNKIVRYFLAVTSAEEVRFGLSRELGRPEHEEFRWLPYHEARKLLVPRVQSILDWAESEISLARIAS